MKKRRIKKSVKIGAIKLLITIIVLVVSIILYLNVGKWGQLAQSSHFYEHITILVWVWLFFGPISVLTLLWEEV
jgi:hypothetical protein